MCVTYLGTGTFSWHADERASDRYGSVCLMGESGTSILDAEQLRTLEGVTGTLVARALSLSPVFLGAHRHRAQVGDHVTLCDLPGKAFLHKIRAVFYKKRPGTPEFFGPYIGIKPVIPRDEAWLNVDALHSIDHATVELYFILPDLSTFPREVQQFLKAGDMRTAAIWSERYRPMSAIP